jgi:hypothetical protein
MKTFGFLLVMIVALAGCASAPNAGSDSIKIVDVKSAKIPGSDITSFRVTASYNLSSCPHGMVLLGFDSEDPGRFKMVSDKKIESGTGEVELLADFKIPKRTVLTVYVNLSEDPHPVRWAPLANDTRQIRVVD